MATYTHPCNEIERRFNETVEQMVEEIRCFSYIQSVKKDYSFLSFNKDIDVISYFESHKSYKGKECDAAIKSFKLFCDDECTFGDINVTFLTAFRKFLLKSKGEDGFRRYAQNTASGYLKYIKRLLKIAFADHLIDFDPSEEIEGIKWDHSCKRESLTEEEIMALKNAPFKDMEVKRSGACCRNWTQKGRCTESEMGEHQEIRRQVLPEYHYPEDGIQGPSPAFAGSCRCFGNNQEERGHLPHSVSVRSQP